MTLYIVEYIGKEGVRTTNAAGRGITAGDPILWPDGTLGRVDTVGTGFAGPDEVHVCRNQGSVFLGLLDNGKPYVSISGGPFETVSRSELAQTMEYRNVHFWNWGDNMRGAGQAVEYIIPRPLWAYTGAWSTGVEGRYPGRPFREEATA